MEFIFDDYYKDKDRLFIEQIKKRFLSLFPKLDDSVPIYLYNSASNNPNTFFGKDYIKVTTSIAPSLTYYESILLFQLSHELTHIVFSIYRNKEDNNKASCLEESICTATSLIMINNYFPKELKSYEDGLISESCFYYNGIRIAKRINYDENRLLDLIINSDIEHSPIANYDKENT